ncbi:hypothetical protein EGR_11296 [Echinococcus granulosus]|uniref:Uncharacterized protein n=1 Tax=Echinococcus granulosus TaxID=6210 RepID=W6TYQ3_ECHGR|nr:hypothetical protein EGR_11296 [Echinococcus granulosus]EUB53853.1 hypothetical protein EGR_11296 [Echinococcus granulosus]
MKNEEMKEKTSEEHRESMCAMCVEAIKWTDTGKQPMKEDYEQMHKSLRTCAALAVQRGDSVCEGGDMKWEMNR